MKFGIVFKKENQKAREVAGEARKFLRKKGTNVVDESKLKDADYILSFGGDGTLIHKASQFAYLGIPLIGINTGNLGFLTACEVGDWKSYVEKIITGDKIYISKRITLDIEIEGSRDKHRAVNEVAVKGLYRVIDLKIIVNSEEFLNVQGDGVIVSTQTGSTAYSLSSGGPIVDSELDCLLVTPINPIGLPIPSVVLSPKDEIEVELTRGDDVSLVIDGQEHQKVKKGQSIKVLKGKWDVKLGYFDEHSFLKALNAKFGLK